MIPTTTKNNKIITQFTNEKNLNNFICNYKQQNTNTSINKTLVVTKTTT